MTSRTMDHPSRSLPAAGCCSCCWPHPHAGGADGARNSSYAGGAGAVAPAADDGGGDFSAGIGD